MNKKSENRSQLEPLLQRYWNADEFRPGQREVIEAVMESRDVMAIFPTGGGKSLCYQLPAVVRKGLVLVVTPLISLMQDQVASLNARGIPAAFINSTLSARTIDQRLTDAEFGRFRLLYVAPERLETELFTTRAPRLKVQLLAVDEAHCVSEWARHFRPSYLRIPAARTALGDPPMIALTATATPYVRRDITELLALKDPLFVIRGFDRPNISWSVVRTDAKKKSVLEAVRTEKGPGILYTATRQQAEEWAEWLLRNGETVGVYHGGLPAQQRAETQENWIRGDVRLMAATNAFGMGIDKSNVRFVLHTEIPGSVEAFYQEAGRSGRDGEPARSVLFYHPSDLLTQKALIDETHPDARCVRQVYDAVCNLAQLPVGSIPDHPVLIQPEAIRKLTRFPTARIRGAVEVLLKQGIWSPLLNRRHHFWIRIKQTPEQILSYADQQPNRSLKRFISQVLRLLPPEVFGAWWEVDMKTLAGKLKLSPDRVAAGFTFLQERTLLEWIPESAATRVVFREPRSARLPVEDYVIQRSRKRAETRLADMQRYAESDTCRRQYLLAYFGEDAPDFCGKCDYCVADSKSPVPEENDAAILLSILGSIRKGKKIDELESSFPGTAGRLDALVEWLLLEGYMVRSNDQLDRYSITPEGNRLLGQHGRKK